MSKPTLFGRSGRLAAAVAIAAGVGLQAADVTVSGVLKRQYYPGGTRATVAAGSATLASTTTLTSGEAPQGVADNYAQRVSGWFKPTTSGAYSFYVASDDDTDFYVSTDASPANKRLVARQTSWGNNLEWITAEGGNVTSGAALTQKSSDTFSPDAGVTTPFASGITLTAGTSYYIEAIHHEGGGGDNLGITFAPFGSLLNNGDASAFTGSVISARFANPTTLSIATQPASVTVSETAAASFTVEIATDGELTPSYQWLRNGAPISGATSKTYTFVTAATDNGAKFSVRVSTPSLPGLTVLNATSAEATLTVESAILVNGSLKREYYAGASREQVNAGTASLTSTTLINKFDVPQNVADNYSQKVSGFFTPPASGLYAFVVAADDEADLFLSTNDKPANKRLIAQQTTWGNSLEWLTAQAGAVVDGANITQKSSLSWSPDAGVTTPFSGGIQLTAGTRYYIEGVHREGGGGDNFAVTFHLISEAAPENGTASAFTGATIATLVPRATITVNTQPASTTAVEGRAATFSVGAAVTGVVTPSFQWKKNGAAIDGATSATYKTPLTSLADNGAKFTVDITAPGAAVTSAEAILTVIPDTFPPAIVSAGALRNEAGAIQVSAIFDEALNLSTVTAANFSLSSGSVTGAAYVENSSTYKSLERGVTLNTTGLTPGNTYTLTVRNVRDLKGNAISTATAQFTVQRLTWAAIGTQNDGMPAGALGVGNDGVNVQAGGNAFWNATDDVTFVYEQVTGDFDKVVKIEEQDASSNWARAGLMVRETLATDSRYQAVHTPDNKKWDGTDSNNAFETNRRLGAGGNTSSSGAGGRPSYPDGTYLRIMRTGDVIHMFRSGDGITWTQLGRTDFLAEGDLTSLPASMYVGIVYGPENGNLPEADRKLWTARFRGYGDFKPNKARGTQTYSIGMNFGGNENSGIMGPREIAGVNAVAQGNWNNLSGNNSETSGAVALAGESAGNRVNTSATVEWAGSPNTWASTGRGEENNAFIGSDRSLLTGFLDTGNATTTTVTVNGIPSQLTSGKYDVVLYSVGGVPDRGGAFRVTDANGNELSGYQVILANANPTNHVLLANPTPLTPSYGTYVVFKGLSASSIIVHATTENGLGQSGTPRAPINAIQLVAPSGLLNPAVNPTIAFDAQGRLVYQGTLQSSATFNGTYTDVSGATSPYTVNPSGAAGFFRTRQ
jgi:hypothetical protein